MPRRENNARPPVELAGARRWSTHTGEKDALRHGWVAWIASIEDGYFTPGSRAQRNASIMIEGVAQGLAWLIQETTTGRRASAGRRRRSAFDVGPGNDLHDQLAESIANSAFRLGRDWLREHLGDVERSVAAQVIAWAAADAIGDRYDKAAEQDTARSLFLIEIRERLGASAPWLAVAIEQSRRPSLFDGLDETA